MNPSTPLPQSRLGFHYYPDTLHYREADLASLLPTLKSLGAGWLTLLSDMDRAIPEPFLRSLNQAGIEPIIQFNLHPGNPPEASEIKTLLEVYARWGVRYILFFDRPNARSRWMASNWTQQDLVERFLDRYLPLANLALSMNMNPVFPALEPGGSYWDTAFLRGSLEALQRRKQTLLLQNLVLGAHAWTHNHSLNWGAGGPERWPLARPYFAPQGSQDQRGFRIYDWYEASAQAVLGQTCPVMLFHAGIPGDPYANQASAPVKEKHTATNLAIAQLLSDIPVQDPENPSAALEPIPPHVIACNFWLLAAEADSPYAPQAWLQAAGKDLPIVAEWSKKHLAQVPEAGQKSLPQQKSNADPHPIQHYLLLPAYEWGISDFHLDAIKPFVKKYRPTIGFSPDEAEMAERVTVVGNTQTFPEEMIYRLRRSGCQVERIYGDGISIATQLAGR